MDFWCSCVPEMIQTIRAIYLYCIALVSCPAQKNPNKTLESYASEFIEGHPWWPDGKESSCNAEDLGSIPGLGRYPGEGCGNPLQYSCLENSMDRGARWAIVHGVAKSRTRLSD